MEEKTTIPFLSQKFEIKSGIEKNMSPRPEYIRPSYKGSGKLEGKVALITGGDSGIGRAVAIHFAREGANVAISFLNQELEDAEETRQLVEKEGCKCLSLPGDLRDRDYCKFIVEHTVKEFGKLNILVNNAALPTPGKDIQDIDDERLDAIFDVNILSFFRVTRAALKYLKEGDSIINTTSINAYTAHAIIVDYSATKGAVVGFTRSLAGQLADKKIRVNAVAPGPIWTPLVTGTSSPDIYKTFGTNTPMGRPGQPSECAPSYVFLASEDASYFTGQCLHPNGGCIINT